MAEIIYRLSLNPCPAIVHDAPAIRRPWILRTAWRLDPARVEEIKHRLRDGLPVNYDRNGPKDAARWHIMPERHYPGEPWIIMDTKPEGVHEWIVPIPAPRTRTPGVWFAWETGEWKRHTSLADCHRYILRDHWHTKPYTRGQDMTPLPPDDYDRHQKSMEI